MHDTVANLYETFKGYRIGTNFGQGDTFIRPEQVAKVTARPLRELSASDLDVFALKTMTTWGSVQQFKHFLPRLFELLLDDWETFSFPEVLVEKLSYGEWKKWPAREQTAVKEFLGYFWTYQLKMPLNYDGEGRIGEVLSAIFEVTGNLEPYLEIINSFDDVHVAHHLREIIDSNAPQILAKKSKMGLLAQSDQFVQWLASDQVRNFMQRHESAMVKATPWIFDLLDGIRRVVNSHR